MFIVFYLMVISYCNRYTLSSSNGIILLLGGNAMVYPDPLDVN